MRASTYFTVPSTVLLFRQINNSLIMKNLICLFFFIFTTMLYAQYEQRSTLGISGNSVTVTSNEKTYYVSESVGQQSVIGTFSNGTQVIRQGFQQPPIRVVTSSLDVSTIQAVVYPNPVSSFVNILFNEAVKNPIQSTLYDVLGRVAINTTISPTQSYSIDMSHLASGTYLLTVTIENRSFTTHLIKN